MAEYIKREEVIALIEERQRELCPPGRFERHYIYGTDREKYDNWQEIIDIIDGLECIEIEESGDSNVET